MRRLLSLVALATVLSACGSDSSTQPTQASVSGTWNLTSVNGQALPFSVPSSSPPTDVLSDQFVIAANGTFTEAFSLRSTTGGTATTQNFNDGGTYTLNGTAASFRFDSDNSVGTGTINGTSMTMIVGGFSSVYTKQ